MQRVDGGEATGLNLEVIKMKLDGFGLFVEDMRSIWNMRRQLKKVRNLYWSRRQNPGDSGPVILRIRRGI